MRRSSYAIAIASTKKTDGRGSTPPPAQRLALRELSRPTQKQLLVCVCLWVLKTYDNDTPPSMTSGHTGGTRMDCHRCATPLGWRHGARHIPTAVQRERPNGTAALAWLLEPNESSTAQSSSRVPPAGSGGTVVVRPTTTLPPFGLHVATVALRWAL